MSKKQWLVLLMLFLTYLLLGASIFYHIESDLEKHKVEEDMQERREIYNILHDHCNSSGFLKDIVANLSHYCGKSCDNSTVGEDSLKWNYYSSFYFAYTVVSTIGYGNLAPTTMLGRILMIFYALIGIPMNGILLSQLGEFFGTVFVQAHKKYKAYKNGQADSTEKPRPLETRRAGLAAQILMYLVPGFVIFIFFPALLFWHFEGWDYDVAVYYAFVTLSTIGFGDYVAGRTKTQASEITQIAYKAFLIVWISFGLGYLVMIMSFITRGMRSKRITRLEHKLAMNLKQTQSRFWHEINKEVNYFRGIFNELYMMKLKPVYRDEYEDDIPVSNSTRSQSFPDLRKLDYGRLQTRQPSMLRRRAHSEVAAMMETKPAVMIRGSSETDLQRIDKDATFASHAMVQSAELLARLVNVLGYTPPPADTEEEESDLSEEKGIDGFSDKDILAGEKPWAGSGWRLGDEKSSGPEPRARAASEIRLQKEENGFGAHQQNMEWTWSGPAASRKIQELIKTRKSGSSTPTKDAKSRFPSFAQPFVPKTTRPRWFNPFSSKKNSCVQSRRESVPADDLETNLRENYLSHTGNTRSGVPLDRRRSAAPHYFTHTGGNLPNIPNSNLLEETSLADFFRALTALHSRVGAIPDDSTAKPQRKMGTASLTPPKLPSLLALFAPLAGMQEPQMQSTQSTITANQMDARRFSLKPNYHSAASSPGPKRRGSSFVPRPAGPRRFSLKPEENTVSSTSSYQRRGSLIPGPVPRRFSLKSVFPPQGTAPQTPPYTPDHIRERQDPPPYSADPFLFECPREPLVPAEVGPAQDGISLPVRNSRVPRRFSLRPAQIGVPPAPASPRSPPTPVRPMVPKWKGGMLQRQISELSLQRRARALSLGDVHSVKNDRAVGQTSPLALPNATSYLQNWSSNRAENTEAPNFLQSSEKTETASQPASINSAPRTVNDAKQTSANSPLNESSLPERSGKSEQLVTKSGVTDLNTVSDVNAVKTTSQKSFSFDFDLPAAGRQESSAAIESPSGKMLTAIKIDDQKMSVMPAAKATPSKSLELQSVLIDKPFGKPHSQSSKKEDTAPPHSASEPDSLVEVKVDPSSFASFATARIADDAREIKTSASKEMRDFGVPEARKVSMTSQKSTESTGEVTNESEKPLRRKISALSGHSVELSSASGSRKSSTSARSDKPRVSIESYKPLLEFKIEKPATNPFEQYKATVQCKLEDPREKKTVLDSREQSVEVERRKKKSATLFFPESKESLTKFNQDSEL